MARHKTKKGPEAPHGAPEPTLAQRLLREAAEADRRAVLYGFGTGIRFGYLGRAAAFREAARMVEEPAPPQEEGVTIKNCDVVDQGSELLS